MAMRPPDFDKNNATLVDQILGPVFVNAPGFPRMSTMGPILFALPVNMLLASVLTVQFTQYWTSTVRKHDAWPTKSLVACCMGCTIGNVVCTWVWSCDVFVLKLGRPSAIFLTARMVPLFILLQVEMFTIHCWFAFKCYNLYERKLWPPVLITTLNVLKTAAGCYAAYTLTRGPSLMVEMSKRLGQQAGRAVRWLNLITDLVITILVLIRLIKLRAGWAKKDTLLARLGLMVFESQMVPTAYTFIMGVYAEATNKTELAYFFAFVGGNIYGLSVMYSLTSRTWFRRGAFRDGRDRYIDPEVHVKTEVSIATSVMPPARVRHAGLRPSPSDEDLSDAYKRDGFEEIEHQVYSVNKGDSQT